MALKSMISSSIILLIFTNHFCKTVSYTTTHIPKVKAITNHYLSNQPTDRTVLSPSPLRNNLASLSQSNGRLSSYPYSPGLLSTGTGTPFPQADDPGVHRELINLGHFSLNTPPCATILTTSNCVLQVPGDATHKDIQVRNFVFAIGLIMDQCSLTVQDCLGSHSTFTNHLHFPPGSQCNTAASVCCECNGCNRPNFPLYEDSCAILFEHEKCSLCHGFRLEVMKGDEIANMNAFVDNRVSSIFVMPGCELKIFQNPNFQGFAALAKGSLDELPSEWNDVISSYACHCNSHPINTTTMLPTTTGISTSTTESASGDDHLGHTTSTENPTSTTSMKSTTIDATTTRQPDTTTTMQPNITTTKQLDTTTTMQPDTTTTKQLDTTTTRQPETTTIGQPDTTTEKPYTTTTGEPTTRFDESNPVY